MVVEAAEPVCEKMKAFILDSMNSNSMKSSNPHSGCRMTETAQTLVTSKPSPEDVRGGIAVVQYEAYQHQGYRESDTAGTLTALQNDAVRGNTPLIAEAAENGKVLDVHPDIAGTLMASGAGMNRPAGMASETDLCVAYCLQGNMIGRQDHNGPRGDGVNEDVSFTLNTIDQHAIAATFCRQRSDLFKEDDVASTQTARQCKDSTDLICECKPVSFASSSFGGLKEGVGTLRAEGGDNGGGSESLIVSKTTTNYIVRRLLPVECERLQGYPDGWTETGHDGTAISDTRRYQMLGNSVAVPCVAYIMLGITEQLRKEAD